MFLQPEKHGFRAKNGIKQS
jgi:hypothetical protein